MSTIVLNLDTPTLAKTYDEISDSQYERGQALVKHCAKNLDKAELKVKQLSGETLTDFDEAE